MMVTLMVWAKLGLSKCDDDSKSRSWTRSLTLTLGRLFIRYFSINITMRFIIKPQDCGHLSHYLEGQRQTASKHPRMLYSSSV